MRKQEHVETVVRVAKIKGGREEVLSTWTQDSRKEKAGECARKVSTSKTKVQRSKMKSTPELKIYDKKWLSQRQGYSEHVNLPCEDEVFQEKTRWGEMLHVVRPCNVLQPKWKKKNVIFTRPRPWLHLTWTEIFWHPLSVGSEQLFLVDLKLKWGQKKGKNSVWTQSSWWIHRVHPAFYIYWCNKSYCAHHIFAEGLYVSTTLAFKMT